MKSFFQATGTCVVYILFVILILFLKIVDFYNILTHSNRMEFSTLIN